MKKNVVIQNGAEGLLVFFCVCAALAYAEPSSPPSGNVANSNIFEDYQIQPGDVIGITVYEEPDLSTRVRVSGSGEINFPLLGQISVSGFSVHEVQDKITAALEKDYLINPQVVIFIETFHDRNVFVSGAVLNPGSYPLPVEKPTTVIEAITMAGGFTKAAAGNKTRIIRVEGGRDATIEVKANDIVKNGDKSQDIEVKPNDVIFVPESFF